MYARIMARLESILFSAAFDKIKHQVVGTWIAAIVFSVLVIVYFLSPWVAVTLAQKLGMQLGMCSLTLLSVWLVAIWNEWRQERLNQEAIDAGAIPLHEVSDADVRATVLGAVPVLLPTVVVCSLMLLVMLL